jgi:hypothetical protein
MDLGPPVARLCAGPMHWRPGAGSPPRLADDARRTVGLMAAMLADAERARADVPAGVAARLIVWRSWAARLAEWAKGGEHPGPPPEH